MKKIVVSFIIAVAMILNIIPVNATENKVIDMNAEQAVMVSKQQVLNHIRGMENIDVNIVESIVIMDINFEDNYILHLFDNNGYAIITKDSYVVSEYCLGDDSNPYSIRDGEKMIYAGPMNYLTLIEEDILYDSYSDINISIEVLEQAEYDEIREINESLIDTPLITTYSQSYITNSLSTSQFAKYVGTGYTNNGDFKNCCGPLAAAIMLSYYQDMFPNLVAFSTSVRVRNSSSNGTLTSKIKSYTPSPTGTLPQDVSVGINNFLVNYNTQTTSGVYAIHSNGGTWSRVVSTINNGKPLCVGMTTIAGSPYGNHWVTVYGYGQNSSGKGYYRCHTNWTYNTTTGLGGTEAVIETSWTIGTVYLSK